MSVVVHTIKQKIVCSGSHSPLILLRSMPSWKSVVECLAYWRNKCAVTVNAMRCCACCGVWVWGNTAPNLTGWKTIAAGTATTVLPAFTCTTQLHKYMLTDSGLCHICKQCHDDATKNQKWVPITCDAYRHRLLSVQPMVLQQLSCVDSLIAVQDHFQNRYTKGILQGPNLFASPFVANLTCSQPSSDSLSQLEPLLEDALLHNCVIQKFKTVIEMNRERTQALALTHNAIQGFIQRSVSRIPLNTLREPCLQEQLKLLLDLASDCQESLSPKWLAGHLQRRSSLLPQELQTSALGRVGHIYTLEVLKFPYLFPHGKGAFTGSKAAEFRRYRKLRINTFFSPFTLHLPYVFFLFMMQQALKWKSSKTLCLDSQAKAIRRSHPQLSKQELYTRLLKRHLPADIYGSPSYFRDRLHDIFAMVDNYGMPSFFATYTADEVLSRSSCPSVFSLDSVASLCSALATAKNAPPQCSRSLAY